MNEYDYKTARTIIKEGCERAIFMTLAWLDVDNKIMPAEFAETDREYINTDLSDYSNAVEGWC